MNDRAADLDPKGVEKSNWLSLAGLVVLLIASQIVYLLLIKLDAVNGWASVSMFWLEMAILFGLYAAAAILVRRNAHIGKTGIFITIAGAVLFRLTLLPAGIEHDLSPSEKLTAMQADLAGVEVTYERFQLFDNDIWRYIWDGHVWSQGINPYAYAPIDPHLDIVASPETTQFEELKSGDDLPDIADSQAVEFDETTIESPESLPDGRAIWSDIRDNVNHANVTTIYPPLAQMTFRLSHALAPGSLLMMKIILVACELVGIFFLILAIRRLGLPSSSVILYAWNPLMIKIFAGSGHADAILVATLCATAYFIVCGWRSLAATAFGLAILAKLSPVIILPFVVRRIGWKRSFIIAAVICLGYLPFIGAGQNLFSGFLKFAREWEFNAGAYGLVRWLSIGLFDDPESFARLSCLGLIVAIVTFLVWRDDLSETSFVKCAAFVIGSSIVLSPTVMPWYLSWVLPLAIMARQNVWIYFSAIVLAGFHVLIDVKEYAYVLWLEHGLLFVLAVRQVWLDRGFLGIVRRSSFG